jgi:hypothetical protein
MDTDDDDESEIDNGEEEKRVKRRHRALLQTISRQGTVPIVVESDVTRDSNIKKKATILLKIPVALDQQRVCNFR